MADFKIVRSFASWSNLYLHCVWPDFDYIMQYSVKSDSGTALEESKYISLGKYPVTDALS